MRVALGLAVTVALAGCVGPSAPAPPPAASAPPPPAGSRVPAEGEAAFGCGQLLSGYVPLTEEEFAAFAPAGFAPSRYAAVAGALQPAPFAGLIVQAGSCTSGGEAMAGAWVLVPVTPPGEVAGPEANALLLAAFFPPGVVRDALADWGLADIAPESRVDVAEAAPPADPLPRAGSARATGGDAAADLEVAGPLSLGFFPAAWRVFGARDGTVLGAFDLARTGDPSRLGSATVSLAVPGVPALESRGGEGHLFGEVGFTLTHRPEATAEGPGPG